MKGLVGGHAQISYIVWSLMWLSGHGCIAIRFLSLLEVIQHMTFSVGVQSPVFRRRLYWRGV